MDFDKLDALVAAGSTQTTLAEAQATAAQLLLANDLPAFPTNACAATLSALLRIAGIDVPLTLGAGKLARRLGGPGTSRGWSRVSIGNQRPGDVGVCFDNAAPEGADHIYLVLQCPDHDRMIVADNQSATPHERYASGKGKTPTEYFLRPSGAAVQQIATNPAIGLMHVANEDLLNAVVSQVCEVAAASELARHDWVDRGRVPAGYVEGMAAAYAIHLIKLKLGDLSVAEMAKAATGNTHRDVLSWYAQQYRDANCDNSAPGAQTLRNLFALLYGLGVRESSGRYCEGRDRNAANTDADAAEAGLFQCSFNLISAHPLLPLLFVRFRGHSELRSIFEKGLGSEKCFARDWESFGEGEGREFQDLLKTCPLFAVEIAAVGLRNARTHWGPVNARHVQLEPKVFALLMDVERVLAERGFDGH